MAVWPSFISPKTAKEKNQSIDGFLYDVKNRYEAGRIARETAPQKETGDGSLSPFYLLFSMIFFDNPVKRPN